MAKEPSRNGYMEYRFIAGAALLKNDPIGRRVLDPWRCVCV